MALRLSDLAKRLPGIQSIVRKNAALKADLVVANASIAALQTELRDAAERPHFVSDYTAMVRQLMAEHPLDEAMSIAVGGDYENTGKRIVDILQKCGLKDGMSVIDMGCGSGRIAKYIGLTFPNMEYLGFDIVQELLDYAADQSPPNYRFVLNHKLAVPAETDSADMFFAFSVFTHLLQEETYLYLEEARRTVKPGGAIVFSFLEIVPNWPIFGAMTNNLREGRGQPHLNMFIERNQIQTWAEHLGLTIESFDKGPIHTGFGQTVVVLRNVK